MVHYEPLQRQAQFETKYRPISQLNPRFSSIFLNVKQQD